MKNSKHLLNLIYIAMFAAVITICAQIQIPTAVPFTLQTLGVFAAGGLLGFKRGTLSVIIYVLLGLVGIPVFSGFKGGIGVLFGPTGGYIIGFIFTAMVVGIAADKFGRKIWTLAIGMAAGLILCYAFGTVWFMIIYNAPTGGISLWEALMMCVIPYLPFDALKIAAAAVLVNRLYKAVQL